jgi:hypothetical protein
MKLTLEDEKSEIISLLFSILFGLFHKKITKVWSLKIIPSTHRYIDKQLRIKATTWRVPRCNKNK